MSGGYIFHVPNVNQHVQANISEGLHALFINLETNTVPRLLMRFNDLMQGQPNTASLVEAECVNGVAKYLTAEIGFARAAILDGEFPIAAIATAFNMVVVQAANALVSRGYDEAVSPDLSSG